MSLDAAYAAFTTGNLAEAERQARAAPADDSQTLLLARIMAAGDRLEEAEALLVPLIDGDNLKPLKMLASLQYRRLAFDACEAALDKLIARDPAQVSPEEFQRLAKLKSRSGRESAALAAMRQALEIHPGNVSLMGATADLLPDENAVAELEAALAALDPANTYEAAFLLKRITCRRASLLRAAAGRPEYGQSWDDTLQWPDADGLERLRRKLIAEISKPAPAAGGAIDAAWVALTQKLWDTAEKMLDHARRGGAADGAAAFAHFGGAFHRELDSMDDESMGRALAPVQTILTPGPSTREALFVASDPKYFHAFTLPLLQSLKALGAPLDIHVHLLDGPLQAWTDAAVALREMEMAPLTLTAEAPDAARNFTAGQVYYHAVRFIRFYQELARGGRPLWMLDADARALTDPRALLARIHGVDVALRSNPLAFEPSLKFMACCVGVAPTARGLAFARRVAAYILRMKESGAWGWGVDQMALFSAYAYMDEVGQAPATLFLGSDAVCLNAETRGTFQFPSGINKYFRDDDSQS